VVVFPEFALSAVATDFLEDLAPVHERPVTEGRNRRRVRQAPRFGPTDPPAGGIDNVIKAADDTDLRVTLEDVQLLFEPPGIGYVVRIHSRDDRRARGPGDTLGAQRRAESALLLD